IASIRLPHRPNPYPPRPRPRPRPRRPLPPLSDGNTMLGRAAASASARRLASSSRRVGDALFARGGASACSTTTPCVAPAVPSFYRRQQRCMNVASRPSDLVGNTPLIDLNKILVAHGVDVSNGVKLLGKLESLGPCSSVKDRLGRSLIDDAEAKGLITPGESILVEPTSGNTGIALAFIARERGYRCILTMPETMSVERRMMLLALGAEVVLTPKETAVPGALAKAKEIVDGLDGKGIILQQFENEANAKVHRETTGPEVWRDTDGLIDVFVSGVGTGVSLFERLVLESIGLSASNPKLRLFASGDDLRRLAVHQRVGEVRLPGSEAGDEGRRGGTHGANVDHGRARRREDRSARAAQDSGDGCGFGAQDPRLGNPGRSGSSAQRRSSYDGQRNVDDRPSCWSLQWR
ncbi:hypothetical protein ACHAWF_015713, partial [Thalassiosira exigua]